MPLRTAQEASVTSSSLHTTMRRTFLPGRIAIAVGVRCVEASIRSLQTSLKTQKSRNRDLVWMLQHQTRLLSGHLRRHRAL